jgi:hypothetical protein
MRMGRGLRVVVLIALVAAVSVAPMVSAEAITRPVTRYHEQAVTAGVVVPGFPMDHVGVVFDLPASEDVTHDHDGDAHTGTEGLAVRFHTDGSWGPWKPMIEDGAQQVGRWTGALVAAGDADAYQVRGVPAFARDARAAALDTTDGPLEVVGHRPAGSADAVTTCRSRADWGADETIRTADRSYAPVQIMTVHHTATQNDDPDPDARVRAIYEYHVRTNGWDDIGYQALISEDGTVYEGRWSGSDSASCAGSAGGTGWDFGHDGTADGAAMVTGAHTGGYNTGNYGIALLGTLSDVGAKAAARDALVEYLAELAHRHGIDPGSQVAYDNGVNAATVDAINGHRDFTATDCPGGELYADLPAIRVDVGAAIAGVGPEVTITSPSDADTYTAQESTSGDGVALTFSAGVVTDSSSVTWSWTDGDGGTGATTSSFDRVLHVGPHTYTATVTDAEGRTGSDVIEVTVLEADAAATTQDDTASGETAVAGTVSGTYLDAAIDDGLAQTITEVESGGRPSLRHSHLEHVWTLDVTGGTTVTLFIDAAASTSSDGDDFVFEYAPDGESFAPVLIVPAGGDGLYSGSLPSTLSGTVHIRVRDTNRTQGARALDRIVVDHLFVRSESESAPAPPAPGSLSAAATTAATVDLAWDDVADEWGYELERGTDTDGDGTVDRWDGIALTGRDVTSFGDTGLAASTTYGYRVRSYNGGGASTWTSTIATTEAVSGISLTASGHKVKGKHHVDLTWSGATSVRVYRDGAPVATVTGTSYTDGTGGSGRGEYTHHVCAIDETGTETGTCSNEVTTTFS